MSEQGRFVLCYTDGDCEYWCDFHCPIEYNGTKEELEFDFEVWAETTFKNKDPIKYLGTSKFLNLELDVMKFYDRDEVGKYNYCGPQFYTLDEWFDTHKDQ